MKFCAENIVLDSPPPLAKFRTAFSRDGIKSKNTKRLEISFPHLGWILIGNQNIILIAKSQLLL